MVYDKNNFKHFKIMIHLYHPNSVKLRGYGILQKKILILKQSLYLYK